ncbi:MULTISPECIES: hypothetical protein [Streptomyces]|uniref:Uncharacterized protein n=1 Tax=Streptomyces chartreusis NRRL 3882 TaxID=1079985 RepID=A0A2N9BBK3_STRCX|nr:hypothetical protein [Streptomyces chartreusis]MYS93248.1 hypothetical protein [Streptomyces sp. SID5464]SOR80738.1 hypothetical protein SCNRRL3882_4191 [Streptomyces chartreusis NRRL 3882]
MNAAPQPARRGTRRNTCARVLVLLLALLVPGAHAEAHAGPTAIVSGESTAVECDVVDTAPRPPARGTRRTAVPLRSAPLPGPGPAHGTPHAAPVPSGPRHDPRPLRSEVLRC